MDIYVHTQFLSLYIITQVDWWELPFQEWRFHVCQFHKHPQSFDCHMNGDETMSITAPLYNFNDLCGPLGQIWADNGRVATFRVSAVKNPGGLIPQMYQKVLAGMNRNGSPFANNMPAPWYISQWGPLAERAVRDATKGPWDPSVLRWNPLPQHFVSVTRVLGAMRRDKQFDEWWGSGRHGAGAILLAGLGYHILRPENIGSLLHMMPDDVKQVLKQMQNRLLPTVHNDHEIYVVAPRQQDAGNVQQCTEQINVKHHARADYSDA